MTTKVAPAYDGRTSFFAFEDAIDDWCDITEIEPEKRGPALRNRLEGDAQQYKRFLDRDMLRDPNEGVNYFKRFLRPHFIKGAQNVFLYRFMQFMKFNRGTMDLQKWMTRFQLTGNRLIESWMDLLPEPSVTNPEAIQCVQQKRQEHERDQQEKAELAAATPGAAPHVVIPWSDELALVAFRQYKEHCRQLQRQAFPLGENLLALIFVSPADLSQDQRNTLTSIMTHRGRTLDQYNIQELRDLFLEMFCTTKTAVDNPMMQPSGMAQRRSFLVLEEGQLEGTDGYWAEDDEDGAEGFLDALEDVFWVYDDADYTWYQRRFHGRQTRRGKGKGRRKGKGKGRGGRRFFRSRKRKGRGKGKRRGRAHMVSKKVMKKIGKKEKNGMNPMKAIGPMIKTGMKAIGPMMICTTWMSMDTSRRKKKEKEKERKARKARMMMAKEESQEMEKASQTMFNLRPHQLLPCRTNNSKKLTTLLLHQALVMVSLLLQRLNQYIDALVVEDRTNVMQQHSMTEKDSRSSLFWLEILMHFDKVYNDVQLVCPGKLVYKKVRLHGSRWQKAHHFFHMDALQKQRYQIRVLFPESACEGFFVKKYIFTLSHLLIYIFTPSHLLIYIFTPSHLLIYIFTPSHLLIYIFTPSHLLIYVFTPSHLLIYIFAPSHLLIYIFTPSHLLIYIFTPSHLLIYIFTPSHLLIYIFTPSHLLIYIFKPSYLLIYIFTPSHLLIYIFTPSHLLIYIFTLSHLLIYIFTPSHLLIYIFTPSHLLIYIFTPSHLLIYIFTPSHLLIYIFTLSHLLIYIFTPSHLLIYIFTPSHLLIYIFTPSHLQIYIFTPSHLQIYIFTPAQILSLFFLSLS